MRTRIFKAWDFTRPACEWHFGPGTRTPYPGGDYYRDGQYIEPSGWDITRFFASKHHFEVQTDPDMVMDEGL